MSIQISLGAALANTLRSLPPETDSDSNPSCVLIVQEMMCFFHSLVQHLRGEERELRPMRVTEVNTAPRHPAYETVATRDVTNVELKLSQFIAAHCAFNLQRC